MYTLHFKSIIYPLTLEILFAWTLRIFVILSGIYHLVWGIQMLGGLILIVLASIWYPSFFTKKIITKFPFEIEIVLLTTVVVTSVLGEGQNFYGTIPYYDKFVHSFIPFFMGMFGFFILFSLRLANRIHISSRFMAVIAILLMLGLQAVWEIAEYVSDKTQFSAVLAWEQAQGNAMEDPYHDTMNDLVVDAVGTIVGTTLAFSWVRNGPRRTHYRLRNLLDNLKMQFKPIHLSIKYAQDSAVYNKDSQNYPHERTVHQQKPTHQTTNDTASSQAIDLRSDRQDGDFA